MTIQYIRWNTLVPCPRNVRKVRVDVSGLALSLAADGLIQNLVVTEREDGKFEVVAGERRRRAIVQLVKAGTWDREVEIPCEVREAAEATTVSYAENTQRVAMHPADAIRAFATMRDEGHNEPAIAHRYGYDPLEVRRMLALASVSPKVINALAADKIDLACAQAFTLTDDHKRQERVLRRVRTAQGVRHLLTETKVTTGHRLFRFVGLEAYERAGGTVTGDLFSEDGEGYADDTELVERLADEKFDALTDEARAEGWGEVIAGIQQPYQVYSWHSLCPDHLPEQRTGGVLVLSIASDGSVIRNAYSKKAPGRSNGSSAATGASAPRPLYDAKMTEELSRMRTAALQVEVARNERLAHAALLDTLLPLVTGNFVSSHAVQLKAGTGIQAPATSWDYNVKDMASPFDGVGSLIEAIPDEPQARFDWLLSLDDADISRLLAACTGALIDATRGKFAGRGRLESADRIARATDLDMREHWEGGIEFFGRISKKAMLAALAEACGQTAADNCAKLSKSELAVACVERISGRGWLPPALVTPAMTDVETDPTVDKAEASDQKPFDTDHQVEHSDPQLLAAE